MVETKDLDRACDLADPSDIGRVCQTIEGQKQLTFKRGKAINDGATSAGVSKVRKVDAPTSGNEDASNVLGQHGGGMDVGELRRNTRCDQGRELKCQQQRRYIGSDRRINNHTEKRAPLQNRSGYV